MVVVVALTCVRACLRYCDRSVIVVRFGVSDGVAPWNISKSSNARGGESFCGDSGRGSSARVSVRVRVCACAFARVRVRLGVGEMEEDQLPVGQAPPRPPLRVVLPPESSEDFGPSSTEFAAAVYGSGRGFWRNDETPVQLPADGSAAAMSARKL